MNLSKLKAVFCMALLIAGSVNSLAQTKKQTVNDLKIRQRFTASGQSFEQTRYIKGARERSESSMEGMPVTIMQCDMKRYVRLNDKSRTYTIDQAQTNNTDVDNNKSNANQRGGVITYNYHRIDTGERKQMFGYTAHRIKTTIEMIPSADACSKATMKMEQDGWYIDMDNGGADCSMGAYTQGNGGGTGGGCSDKVKMNFTGTQNYKFPLDETTTMFMPGGANYTSRTEVIEMSREQLSATLFEVPAGYTQVKDMTELMSANNNVQMTQTSQQVSQPSNASQSSQLSQLPDLNGNSNYPSNGKQLPSSMSNSTQPAVAKGAKKEGMIRIGVVMPKVQTSSGAEMADPIRNSVVQYLAGPAVEVTTLEARVPAQIEAEAKQKECDFILYTNVNHKKGGGGFGGMFGKVAPVINQVPVYGSTGAVVAGSVAKTTIMTAANMSDNVKNKDEITLEYQLVSSASSAQVAANKLKGKAKADGEDVFSPLLEQMATNVLSVAVKR